MPAPKRTWLIIGQLAALTAVLGVIDTVTGYELNFFVFYFVPVSLSAWRLGRNGASAFAFLCAAVWACSDYLAGHPYSTVWFGVWNTAIRLISFLAIGWSIAKIGVLLERERKTAEALRQSMSEIKVLKSFLPICAECKKIRDEQGEWHPLESYISQNANTSFSHGYCPACARKAMEQAGPADDLPQHPGNPG